MTLLFSLLPIVTFILLLGVCRLTGATSSFIALLTTLAVGMSAFQFPAESIVQSLTYGSVKALFPILFIVTTAMFSYNLLQSNGQMEIIKKQFSQQVSERSSQVLLIAWGFSGLLESMAGFGTAEAICVSLLISLGYHPLFSATACLLGNSIMTAFGAVGTPIVVLSKETGISTALLGVNIVWQLALFTFLFPLVLLIIATPRWKAIPEHLLLALLVGIASLTGQVLAVTYIGVETPSMASSLCSIGMILLYNRFKNKKEPIATTPMSSPTQLRKALRAWSVYLIILILILITSPLFPSIRHLLENHCSSHLIFTLGTQTVSYDIHWLLQSGFLIGIGTLAGGRIQGIPLRQMLFLFYHTVLQLRNVFITLICLISLSTIMNYSGMIGCIANALAAATGSSYPFFSPLIGCLGTFITGSGTSANILFGRLQADVASQLHVSPDWLAAGNMSGTTAGKIFSPQSVAIVTSHPTLKGKEGLVMKQTFPYALIYVCLIGVIVYAFC